MRTMKHYNLGNLDVLIVEHHNYMRRIIRDILQTLGIRKVHEAANEAEALSIFKEKSIDIVLTDWSPVVDGIMMLHEMRDMEASSNPYVPVIIISANTDPQHVVYARDRGMTEFLAKPVSPKSLYTRIQEIIENPRAFVRTAAYFGPDRRRRQTKYNGPDRRQAEDSDKA